jgi:hypothetical protein
MRRSPENQHEHPSFVVASRRQRLACHPRADVGGTTRDSNALSLAPHQESDSLHVHETNFDQIEDDVSTARFLDAPTELGQLRGADSAAHGQDGGAGINRDLLAAIAAGTVRSDLFYRLNVFPIHVPALRQRPDDIPILVEYFVKRFAEKMAKRIRQIEKRTLELCERYQWPGNIRELQNTSSVR